VFQVTFTDDVSSTGEWSESGSSESGSGKGSKDGSSESGSGKGCKDESKECRQGKECNNLMSVPKKSRSTSKRYSICNFWRRHFPKNI